MTLAQITQASVLWNKSEKKDAHAAARVALQVFPGAFPDLVCEAARWEISPRAAMATLKKWADEVSKDTFKAAFLALFLQDKIEL